MTAAELVNLLKDRGWMLATAESCTGGLIAGAVTDIAGSSAVFDRAFITYSNAAKTEMLDVPADLIARVGAVSQEVAEAMADGALSKSNADVAVSVTGIAGPGGSEHKPEGRVCFAVAHRALPSRVETIDFGPLGRDKVRQATVQHALILVAGMTEP